jgi:hypothetical protein
LTLDVFENAKNIGIAKRILQVFICADTSLFTSEFSFPCYSESHWFSGAFVERNCLSIAYLLLGLPESEKRSILILVGVLVEYGFNVFSVFIQFSSFLNILFLLVLLLSMCPLIRQQAQ